MRRCIVNEEAMPCFLVFAQAFSMITGDYYKRSTKQIVRRQKIADPSDKIVYKGDFPIVKSPGFVLELRTKWLGRIVRGVRIVKMDPREEPACFIFLEPL